MGYKDMVLGTLTQTAIDERNNVYFNMAQEVEEVYRKARAFDEIREIEKTSDITGYHEDAESYMYEVEHVIEKYDMEDKRNA